jgi:alpha-tubulin suppressor-like RCC1 family protein
MDVTNLIFNLKSTVTTDSMDQQMISKAIALLELGAVVSIGNFENIPSAVENEGKLYFVEYDGLYFSDGYVWIPVADISADTIWSWGLNTTSGNLGDNTNVDKSSPVSVVGGFTDWCQVSAHGSSFGIRADGTLWGWGLGSSGQLGFGYAFARFSPVLVAGGFTDWCQVDSGGAHTLGVRANGTLWAWGLNSQGRLGDNTTVSKRSPVSVVGGFTDWCQASAGCAHSLAVRTDGTLWAWGCANSGLLGDNTTVSKSSPVSVVGGFTDWCQASAGTCHSTAIRTNGSLWTWGSNVSGRLGDGTTISKLSPVSVVGGFTDWCRASTGYSHTLGVRANGTLWAWGNNSLGQLGDNTSVISRTSPVSVVGGFTDWCQASAGLSSNSHSLGLRTNGTLWAWGSGLSGRLGDNTTLSKSSPVSVVSGFTDWCQISAGDSHSLAIRRRQV